MGNLENVSVDDVQTLTSFDFREVAFLYLHEIPFKITILEGTGDSVEKIKVGFILPNNEMVLSLIAKFKSNDKIPIQDFIRAEKHIKDIMLPLIRESRYRRHVAAPTIYQRSY
jgi:hypothetical protein